MAKVSVVVPWHFMENWEFFLMRCLKSIESQSFKDYEVILMKVGSMPETSNRVIEASKGELVKILYMDDYLGHENALQFIVDNFEEQDHWLVTGCVHQTQGEEERHTIHLPKYAKDIHKGNNTIGSPSVLTFRREGCLLFDARLSWLLDCDLYRRLYDSYGLPKIVNDLNVVIGIGNHQTSHLMSLNEKQKEYDYLDEKFV